MAPKSMHIQAMSEASKKVDAKRLLLLVLVALVLSSSLLVIVSQAGIGVAKGSDNVAMTSASGVPLVAYATNRTVIWNNTTDNQGLPVLDVSANYTVAGRFQGFMYNFTWTFNDSKLRVLYGFQITYKWTHVGVFNVTLNASDPSKGVVKTAKFVVTVIPKVNAGSNREVLEKTNATLIVFNGTARDNVGIVNYTWSFNYSGKQYWIYAHDKSMNYSTWSFNFTRPGKYPVVLTVRDALGFTASETINITIRRIPTFFEKNLLTLIVGVPLLIIAVAWVVTKWRRDHALVTNSDREKIRLQLKSLRSRARLFRDNKLGMGGVCVLVIFAVMAITAPLLATVKDPAGTLEPNSGTIYNPMPPSFSPSPVTGVIHPFGTDAKGQDVYSLTLFGARASIEVGLAASMISIMLGTMIGLGAGYFGRVLGEILMRITDFFLVLPWFPLMIVMMAILGRHFIIVIIVIGITSWPSTARVVRAQVLTVKERQFIVRARAIGAGDGHIIGKHILPNVLPLIFANTVLLIANAIFSEAFLDFFGLGDPSIISWGSMLEAAYEQVALLRNAWWWVAAPGISIVAIVLAFSLVGYAIDDVMNPKLRKR